MNRLYNTAQKFGIVTKILHWSIGLTIIGMVCLGIYMEELAKESELRPLLYMTHKSLGLIVLPFAVAWVFSWLIQKKPDPLKEIPRPLQRFSKLVHMILLVCAVGMPLSGWIMSSAFSGQGIPLFNLITIPPIAAYDPAFARAILGLHILISWILMAAVSVHIFAALYHHFFHKNIILRRMLPFGKPVKGVKKRKKTSNVHHLSRK